MANTWPGFDISTLTEALPLVASHNVETAAVLLASPQRSAIANVSSHHPIFAKILPEKQEENRLSKIDRKLGRCLIGGFSVRPGSGNSFVATESFGMFNTKSASYSALRQAMIDIKTSNLGQTIEIVLSHHCDCMYGSPVTHNVHLQDSTQGLVVMSPRHNRGN